MTSSGWTRQHRCEYRQTTVQEPWGATLEANQEGGTNNTAERLEEVSELLERNTGIKFDHLELLADRRAFDWTSGRFYWKSRSEVIAAFDLRTLD